MFGYDVFGYDVFGYGVFGYGVFGYGVFVGPPATWPEVLVGYGEAGAVVDEVFPA